MDIVIGENNNTEYLEHFSVYKEHTVSFYLSNKPASNHHNDPSLTGLETIELIIRMCQIPL